MLPRVGASVQKLGQMAAWRRAVPSRLQRRISAYSRQRGTKISPFTHHTSGCVGSIIHIRFVATARPRSPHHFPPIRPQLEGATASKVELFWYDHKWKIIAATGVAATFSVLGFSKAAWIVLGVAGVAGSIFGLVWYRLTSAPKKLHHLLPVLEEEALAKRSLLSKYLGNYEFPPASRAFCKVHEEQTPVGKREIAVFAFEVRGTRGFALAQAKFVKTKVSSGACSDIQAAASTPNALSVDLARSIDEVRGHKDALMDVEAPRSVLQVESPEWTLVSFFADAVDVKQTREAHIVFTQRDEKFYVWDTHTKKLHTEIMEKNPFESKPAADGSEGSL